MRAILETTTANHQIRVFFFPVRRVYEIRLRDTETGLFLVSSIPAPFRRGGVALDAEDFRRINTEIETMVADLQKAGDLV